MEQLGRDPEGYHETNLIWKENHPSLQNNKSSSLGRLSNLIRNLNRLKSVEAYDKLRKIKLEKDLWKG